MTSALYKLESSNVLLLDGMLFFALNLSNSYLEDSDLNKLFLIGFGLIGDCKLLIFYPYSI